MKHSFLPFRFRLLAAFTLILPGFGANAQNIGIGTTDPKAKLHVNGINVAFSREEPVYLPDHPPISGPGWRLMWYGARAAFRAGAVEGTQWDHFNVGNYSVAMGYNTTASGSQSVALGFHTSASGQNSTALGLDTRAAGYTSTATGYLTNASGGCSTAMGSTVGTNNYGGAFIIGDYREAVTNSSAANQMTMRFGGGYRLLTGATGNGASSGVTLAANGSSWASISDSTRKENFLPANGGYFLEKIAALRLGSWNYKEQDKAAYRHYGPMAQELFAAFGHDGIGTIGTDTTIATADIDGIMMIAIKELAIENGKLKAELDELRIEKAGLKAEVEELKAGNTSITSRLEKLEALSRPKSPLTVQNHPY